MGEEDLLDTRCQSGAAITIRTVNNYGRMCNPS